MENKNHQRRKWKETKRKQETRKKKLRNYIKEEQEKGNYDDIEIWRVDARFIEPSHSEYDERDEKEMEQNLDTIDDIEGTRNKVSNQGKKDLQSPKLEEEHSNLNEISSFENIPAENR